MVTALRQYIDDISTFDEIETGLISFSDCSVRSGPDDISELIESISEHGLLEPIIVRPRDGRFEVVAGNRRLRACKVLRYRKVSCIVTDTDDPTSYEISIVENVQRKTLSPLEEAVAFKKYCELWGWGSQTQLAKRTGKSQEYISHRIKLLGLPEKARLALQAGSISPTAAQELSWIDDGPSVEVALELLQSEGQTTKAIRSLVRGKRKGDRRGTLELDYGQLSRKEDQTKPLKEAILILRISLVRLDSVIVKVRNPEMRKQLLSKRFVLHQAIDDLIQTKSRDFDQILAK